MKPLCNVLAVVMSFSCCIGLSAAETKSTLTNPQAESFFKQGQDLSGHRDTLAKALSLIEKALALQPNNPRFLTGKSSILHDLEEDEQAISIIKKSLELDTNNRLSWRVYSQILESLKREPEALAAANHSIRLGEGGEAHVHRGIILKNMGRFAEAEQEFDLVIKEDPDHCQARECRMVSEERQNHWQKYIADCDYLLRAPKITNLNECKMMVRRAKAYTRTKQYDKALADFNTVIRFTPDDRQAHAGLLELYKVMGNTKGVATESDFLRKLDNDLGF